MVSFSVFLLISYLLIGMSLVQLISDDQPAWYTYLVIGAMTPLAVYLTFRVFINHKVVTLANNQITIRYSVKRKIKNYDLGNVVHWKESTVKTGKSSTFKEIEIQFDDRFKIVIALNEYSNYPQVYAYLAKKLPGKKLTGH